MCTAIIALNSVVVVAMNHRHTPHSEYNEDSCPRRCSEEYHPLCGANKSGETTKVFVNDCYMAMENCNRLPSEGTTLSMLYALA